MQNEFEPFIKQILNKVLIEKFAFIWGRPFDIARSEQRQIAIDYIWSSVVEPMFRELSPEVLHGLLSAWQAAPVPAYTWQYDRGTEPHMGGLERVREHLDLEVVWDEDEVNSTYVQREPNEEMEVEGKTNSHLSNGQTSLD